MSAAAQGFRWYHTLELPGGVVTEGRFDLRSVVHRVPLPVSLAGRRCLDVGTWDGFWAFEMERRGAAEVLAIDVVDPAGWDWPAGPTEGGRAVVRAVKGKGQGFEVARAALRSAVQRLELSVYDLDPERVGRFDLVMVGDLLLHLRDPVGALERVRSVCAGELVVADTIQIVSSLLWPRTPVARLEGRDRPWWWQPNRAALERVVESAGFEIVARSGIYFLPLGRGAARPGAREALRYLRTPDGRERLVALLRGVPHAAVRARPAA